MKWMLDTNVISAWMRRQPAVVARWRATWHGDLLMPAIVLAEGLYGARKARSERWIEAWQALAQGHVVAPFNDACADCYATLRADLEQHGQMIGLHDCEIAATALAWQATHPEDKVTLVTANTSEFARVPGLWVENWLTP